MRRAGVLGGFVASLCFTGPSAALMILFGYGLSALGDLHRAGCYEVLKPGGLFVAFENTAPRTPEAVHFGIASWRAFLIEHDWIEQDADRQVARYGREFLPITAEEHLAALTQMGFSVVELFWYSQMQAGFYAFKWREIPSTYPDI